MQGILGLLHRRVLPICCNLIDLENSSVLFRSSFSRQSSNAFRGNEEDQLIVSSECLNVISGALIHFWGGDQHGFLWSGKRLNYNAVFELKLCIDVAKTVFATDESQWFVGFNQFSIFLDVKDLSLQLVGGNFVSLNVFSRGLFVLLWFNVSGVVNQQFELSVLLFFQLLQVLVDTLIGLNCDVFDSLEADGVHWFQLAHCGFELSLLIQSCFCILVEFFGEVPLVEEFLASVELLLQFGAILLSQVFHFFGLLSSFSDVLLVLQDVSLF